MAIRMSNFSSKQVWQTGIMRSWLAAGVVALLLAAGCSLGKGNVFSLSVGDCFNGDAVTYEPIVATDVDVVSCSELHMYEVYHRFELTGSSWPGESSVIGRSEQGCLTGFAPFVGIEYDYSEWYIQYSHPLEDSWNKVDDRKVTCFLGLEYEQTTGSARGTRR